MQKIVTNLWFDNNAEEAAQFYVSVFKNARIVDRILYTEGSNGPAGTPVTVTFEIDGTQFTGINGGPQFKLDEAVSLQVNCADQAEIDRLWEFLSEGGEKSWCGWVRDRFGLWWQLNPVVLDAYLKDPDRNRAQRVMTAMLKMQKIEIAELERAYRG